MALPTETEIKDIYNPQDPDKALTQIEDSALSSDDRLPVVDAANGNLYNATIKQVTKALDKQSLVIKLDGVVVYDSSPADTVYIEKDSRIQINNGNTIRISTDAPWSGVGTKLLVMASGGTATIAIGSAEQGGKSYTIPDQKYIELIYSVGGWTFYSQMVSLTLAEYEALGDVVNSDNVIYCITDDQASMLSSPTVSSIYVQNGVRIDGGLTVNGGANIGGDVSVSGALNVNGENLYDTLSQYAKINSLGIQYHRVYAGNHNANIVDLNLVSGIYHLVGFQAEKMFDMYYYCNGNTASYCATTQNMNILSVGVNQIYINTALDWLVVDIIA